MQITVGLLFGIFLGLKIFITTEILNIPWEYNIIILILLGLNCILIKIRKEFLVWTIISIQANTIVLGICLGGLEQSQTAQQEGVFWVTAIVTAIGISFLGIFICAAVDGAYTVWKETNCKNTCDY